MSYLDRLDDRINVMSRLQSGWLDGEGEPVRETALAWARSIREASATGLIRQQMYLYPTPGGGLRFEYDKEPFSVSVEFLTDGGAVDFDATCVRSPSIEDMSIIVRSVLELADKILAVSIAAERWTWNRAVRP